MAFRKSVQVEQKLFSRACRLAPPPMDRILLSFFRPREIKIPATAVRNGKIHLLDAPQHLLIELLLESLGGLQNRVRVCNLAFKGGDDFRLFLVAEPSVMCER